MKTIASSIIAGLCAGILCASSALAAETLRIGGGSSPMENIFKRVKEPFQQKTGITLELVESGAVDAYTGLMEGRLDVAASGMGSLKKWQEMVSGTGADAVLGENLVWRTVGTYLITVFTNKNIAVPELDKKQIAQIFTGRITNWKEVGGPDAPIVVILGEKLPVLTGEFRKRVLDDAPLVQTAVYAGDSNDVKAKVMATPNSVAIGSSFQMGDGSVNAIRYPAPQLNISMLWKFNSPKRESIQTLYEYLGTAEGKKYTLSGTHEHDGSRHAHDGKEQD